MSTPALDRGTPPGGLPLPGLRLPLARRRLGPGAALAAIAHAVLVGMLVAGGQRPLGRAAGSGANARAGGGGRQVNFFALPAAGPAQVDVAAAPRLRPSDLTALRGIRVDLPPLELGRAALLPPAPAVGGGGGGPGGTAAGAGGTGTGLGSGAGPAAGPGTGAEAGYIFPASPRTAILPPLARVPGAVAGRWYHVRFSVATDGRVTRVDVDPPIADAEYGREFQQHMMAYRFYPAHTRDGRNVAYVATIPLRIGH
jgi:hypothetical protein